MQPVWLAGESRERQRGELRIDRMSRRRPERPPRETDKDARGGGRKTGREEDRLRRVSLPPARLPGRCHRRHPRGGPQARRGAGGRPPDDNDGDKTTTTTTPRTTAAATTAETRRTNGNESGGEGREGEGRGKEKGKRRRRGAVPYPPERGAPQGEA